jgi:tetratricopeptide (TPR) repeat protein
MLFIRHLAGLAAVVAATSWVGTAPLAQTVEQIIDRVTTARTAAENTENIRALDSMIAAENSPRTAMHLRAMRAISQLNMANNREALADLDIIIASDRPSWETRGYALATRGGIFQRQGDYDKALADYLDLRETPGWSVDGNYHLAYLELEHRNFADVIKWASAITQPHPLKGHALSARGVAHRALGNPVAALADQDAALALDPTRESVMRERACALAEMGQHDQALAILRSLHEKSVPRLKDAHLIDMIPIYLAAGRYDEARRTAQAIAVLYESQGWQMVVALQQREGRGIPKVDARGAEIPLSWPFVIGSLYGGHASPEQVLQSIKGDPFARTTGVEARAYYAIAHYHLGWGDRDAARQAFRSVLATVSYERAEFMGARLGLQRLER